MAVVYPAPARGGRRGHARRVRPRRRGPRDGGGRSAGTAQRAARSTSRSTTSSARRLGLPVHELRGLSADIPPTDFTIGIDEPAVVAERAARAADFPALKIKCGGPEDLATLEAVRGRVRRPDPGRREHGLGARRRRSGSCPELERLGVELIEQPFPAGRLDQLALAPGTVARCRSSPTRVASCPRTSTASSGVVAGVNVKLAKCGGIGPAKRMLERARALGFKTFLGCMEETSVGIAGSAVVASLADWVDLDGCLLLADDPFEGLELDADHRWILTAATGPRADPPGS